VLETKQKENEECESKMKLLKEQISKNDSEILRLKQNLEEKLHGDWYEILRRWEEAGNSPRAEQIIRKKVLCPFWLNL
jgi:hypothetical protein